MKFTLRQPIFQPDKKCNTRKLVRLLATVILLVYVLHLVVIFFLFLLLNAINYYRWKMIVNIFPQVYIFTVDCNTAFSAIFVVRSWLVPSFPTTAQVKTMFDVLWQSARKINSNIRMVQTLVLVQHTNWKPGAGSISAGQWPNGEISLTVNF